MTKDDRITSFRYSVLQHLLKHNNITHTYMVIYNITVNQITKLMPLKVLSVF